MTSPDPARTVALVTGAASGIGKATAERLAADGFNVVLADVNIAEANELADELGSRATAIEMDVSDAVSVKAAFDVVQRELGRLDVLVNNAGIVINGSADEMLEEDWDRLFSINLKGVYLVSRSAWPLIMATGGASVVNLGSLLGVWAKPAEAAYCASKAGVVMLSRCMALDGARLGIRVNCVCPGYIDTPITRKYLDLQPDPVQAENVLASATPIGRLGKPADIADTIAFLASDQSRFITGAVIAVDGGVTCGIWGDSAISEGLYDAYRLGRAGALVTSGEEG